MVFLLVSGFPARRLKTKRERAGGILAPHEEEKATRNGPASSYG
jgi:hypothetical protein